jgi:hypothetical protein
MTFDHAFDPRDCVSHLNWLSGGSAALLGRKNCGGGSQTVFQIFITIMAALLTIHDVKGRIRARIIYPWDIFALDIWLPTQPNGFLRFDIFGHTLLINFLTGSTDSSFVISRNIKNLRQNDILFTLLAIDVILTLFWANPSRKTFSICGTQSNGPISLSAQNFWNSLNALACWQSWAQERYNFSALNLVC